MFCLVFYIIVPYPLMDKLLYLYNVHTAFIMLSSAVQFL
jgi:hypothetical protein